MDDKFLQDNPAWPLSKRIRNFYNDHSKKVNIHDVMERNGCPVDYHTAKSRLCGLGWSDIAKILTTPAQENNAEFRRQQLIDILNSQIGGRFNNRSLVDASGFTAKDISQSMKIIYETHSGLRRIKGACGAYTFVVEHELEENDNTEIESGVFFVDKSLAPRPDTGISNPNWFIVKRF